MGAWHFCVTAHEKSGNTNEVIENYLPNSGSEKRRKAKAMKPEIALMSDDVILQT